MKDNEFIDIKEEAYYRRERSWTNNFDIKQGSKVLDVGCGHGLLGKYLKDTLKVEVHGVELVDDCYEAAKTILDKTYHGNIETMDLSDFENDYDYIIFSDCLEHLINPDLALKRIRHLLNNDGILLISIPNVQNFRITAPLILKGSWEYTDEGLMDRTHLRWFTYSSITSLVNKSGFEVEEVSRELPYSSLSGILNILFLTFFKNHLTSHFYLKACLRKS